MSVFADRLKCLREKSGWSLLELARRSGLVANSISRYERGKGEPTMFALGLLADTFGVTTDWLAGRDGKVYRIIIDVTTENIQGVKECLAMQMERFGDMKVIEVKEIPECGDQIALKGSETT